MKKYDLTKLLYTPSLDPFESEENIIICLPSKYIDEYVFREKIRLHGKYNRLMEGIGDENTRAKMDTLLRGVSYKDRCDMLSQCYFSNRNLFNVNDSCFAVVNLWLLDSELTAFVASIEGQPDLTSDEIKRLYKTIFVLETESMIEVSRENNLAGPYIIHSSLYIDVVRRAIQKYNASHGDANMGIVFSYFIRGFTQAFDIRARLEDHRFELVKVMAKTANYII